MLASRDLLSEVNVGCESSMQYTVATVYPSLIERDTGPSPVIAEEYMLCPALWILRVGLTNEPVPGA